MAEEAPVGAERPTSEQLERIVKRLDRANVRGDRQRDHLFGVIARLGKSGLSVGIGMLVDGVMIAGAVTPSSIFGDVVADAADDAMAGFGWSGKPRSDIVSTIRELEPKLTEFRTKAEDVADRYPADANVDTVAPDDVFDYYRAFQDPPTVDLQNVTMTLPGHPESISLSTLRVDTDRISAWWPLVAQDGAVVTYSPSPVDPEL